MLLFVRFFVCTVTDFSAAEKDSGVKRRMLVPLLPGQVFSHLGELWLACSHGGGITSGMSYIEITVGQSELGAAPSRKGVRWDLRLASLLTHLFARHLCAYYQGKSLKPT